MSRPLWPFSIKSGQLWHDRVCYVRFMFVCYVRFMLVKSSGCRESSSRENDEAQLNSAPLEL